MIGKKNLFTNLIFYSFVILFILFLSSTVFFFYRFYPGTIINGVNVSFKTTKEADRLLTEYAKSYQLVLYERNHRSEKIDSDQIGLKYDLAKGCNSFKKKQNQSIWMISVLKQKEQTYNNAFSYDAKRLKKTFSQLGCLDKRRVIEPKNATLQYKDGLYEIIKEEWGNKVNAAILFSEINRAIEYGTQKVDLEKSKCYYNPTITSNSAKLKSAKKIAEKYILAEITYPYPGGYEVVDKSEISKWIEFDHKLNITFNVERMKGFLSNLAINYDTCGKVRDFSTSSGAKIKVSGGDYGWRVDVNKESVSLTEAIVNGRKVAKEPIYSQRGAVKGYLDIGTTYVEIDMTKQYLWFYKGGVLLAQGAVVTGNLYNGYKTPEGIYSLKYKVEDAVLRGENYRSKVDYWMPFNKGIGIHDATWRTQFGGEIYKTMGSHGCINAPPRLAKTIYQNITAGTPIICYY